ncbi:hypothetical protein WJX77_007815 [Trebouxia sp. C0004]
MLLLCGSLRDEVEGSVKGPRWWDVEGLRLEQKGAGGLTRTVDDCHQCGQGFTGDTKGSGKAVKLCQWKDGGLVVVRIYMCTANSVSK